MIWAMILAAGQSKRMGKSKLLLPFGEKTIIETVIENVIQSKAEKILVVLGSNREEVEVETPSILKDIDDMEDYRRELKK